AAFVAPCEFIADFFQVVDFAHNAVHDLRHCHARLGQALDALAMAFEDLDAQLVFKLDDGFRDARLRGIERARRLGQVVVTSDGFSNKLELLKNHGIGTQTPGSETQCRCLSTTKDHNVIKQASYVSFSYKQRAYRQKGSAA